MSFILTGKENYLSEITKALAIEPSRIKKKEEFRVAEYASFMWEFTTGKQHSKSVDFQSEELLKLFRGKEEVIVKLVNSYNLKPDLVVIIHAEIGDGPEINLSKEIIKFAAEIEAEIGFDVYFY